MPTNSVRREASYSVTTQGDTFAVGRVAEALAEAERDAASSGGRVSVHVTQHSGDERMDTTITFLVRS